MINYNLPCVGRKNCEFLSTNKNVVSAHVDPPKTNAVAFEPCDGVPLLRGECQTPIFSYS